MTVFKPVATDIKRVRNRLADKHQDEIDSALRGYIIPSRENGFTQYDSKDAPLYVQNREWKDIDKTYAKKKFGYELLVNDFFWNKNIYDEKKKVLVILGECGIGKSTFIQHYLRCFCPETPLNGHSFQKKLIIYFDGKPSTNEELFEAFFLDSINIQLKEFSLPPVKAEGNSVLSILKAFTDLSAYAKKNDKHLVVCIDNIDQCSFDIQTHASSIIHKLIEDSPEIHIWKIIFPLWPETFHKLKVEEKFNIRGEKFREIQLGYVNSKKMLFRRLTTLKDYLSDSDDKQARKYFSRIRDESYESVRNLCAKDNKLILKMMGDLLSSEGFYHYQDNSKNPMKYSLKKYEFQDILICGQFNHHHPHNVIINFFNILDKKETPLFEYCLLGIIALKIFKEASSRIYVSEFIDSLAEFGFTANDARDVLCIFKVKNLLNYIDNRETEVQIHKDSVDEYCKLILSPAYLDNMALVTPLSNNYRKKMRETYGFVKGDFKPRVETTIQFIKFIQKCELKLEDKIHSGKRDFYSIWKELSLKYYNRLRVLRHDNRYLKKIASENDIWWDSIMDDELFLAFK